MKTLYITLIVIFEFFIFSGCNDFLDQKPDQILTNEQVFSDPVMIKSVLSNFYGRVSWGEKINDLYSLTILDDAAKTDGGPDYRSTFENDRWRVYDYTLLRNINQFLKSLRSSTAIAENEKQQIEGEARFLRAWCYFNMCRCLGGVSLIGDEVFDYEKDKDIVTLQIPRATEEETYNYIIDECQQIAPMLSTKAQKNSARANKWTAKMLESRAALYAGSLANYNNKMSSPIQTSGKEVGIPADKANAYYTTALAAANEVILSGVYQLQDAKPDDKARNFYEATSIKTNNTEVIWAKDYLYPGITHGFTQYNIPRSHAEDIDNSYSGPVLNLVEQFEEINTNSPGTLSNFITKENGEYKFYNSADAPFLSRDPRLGGSVLYPGSFFKEKEVVLQTGQLIKDGSGWKTITGDLNSYDENKNLITSLNGPKESNEQYINKTGFYFRKFFDETPGAATRGRRSEMWIPYFRISEAYMIAAEASYELKNGKAKEYINAVRTRAGVKPLQTVTFENIVHEDRVEFAFEDHRYWDMKRWRLADKVWNGNNTDRYARHRRLWPYKVVAPGDSNDGKWVFIEDFLFMSPNARYFKKENYYNFIDLDWINKNPLLVKNPYQ